MHYVLQSTELYLTDSVAEVLEISLTSVQCLKVKSSSTSVKLKRKLQ